MNYLTDTVAYHTFEADSGTSVEDRSGTGNSPAVNGATWSTAPLYLDGAMSFDGTDDNLQYSANPFGTTSPGVFGMEAWVYPTDASGRHDVFGMYQMFDLTWHDLNSQGFAFRTWGDNDGGSLSPTGLSMNAWHHVNLYWDVGVEIGMSVNGGAWATYATTDGVDDESGPFYIGEHGAGGFNWAGKIGPVRLTTGSKIPISDSMYYTAGSVGNMTDSGVQKMISGGVQNLL